MATYVLRDLPQGVWDTFKARGQREGWPLRALFLQLMSDYGAGLITPSTKPGHRPESGLLRVQCSNGHVLEFAYSKAWVKEHPAVRQLTFHCPICGEAYLPLTADEHEALEWWAHTLSPPQQ